MNRSRKYWKRYAKDSLNGNWGVSMAGMLAVAAVSFIGSIMSVELFPGNTIFSLVLGQIFSFIFSLIAIVFRAGYNYMLLNEARGKEFSLGNILYLFHNQPDRVLIAGFAVSILDMIAQIPFYYVVYMTDQGNTLEQQVAWVQMAMAMFLLSLVLNVILTVPFVLAFYLLTDDPEMGGMEALKTSARLMKGNILKYWLMMLSFVPLLILSVFTMYIGLLWLLPYMYMTETVFYMDIMGELNEESVGPQTEETEFCNCDDYNSEA